MFRLNLVWSTLNCICNPWFPEIGHILSLKQNMSLNFLSNDLLAVGWPLIPHTDNNKSCEIFLLICCLKLVQGKSNNYSMASNSNVPLNNIKQRFKHVGINIRRDPQYPGQSRMILKRRHDGSVDHIRTILDNHPSPVYLCTTMLFHFSGQLLCKNQTRSMKEKGRSVCWMNIFAEYIWCKHGRAWFDQ